MAQIYLKHLGLADKNSNGVIENGADEGYEAFTAKYGNADSGFHANGVIYGKANGKLEEPEIINHYYIKLRFKPDFQQETDAIEGEIKAYVYANNIPLVWLDDQQGTVMKAVNRILGEGWNEREVTEDEAVRMFRQIRNDMYFSGRSGDPNYNGYFTLPEFVSKKYGYCFEAAQFVFWFFSQLHINSIAAYTSLTSSVLHEVVKLNSGRIIDYFGTAAKYRVASDKWQIDNPLQSLALFYVTLAEKDITSITLLENTVIYDKYNLFYITNLMYREYDRYSPDYEKIISLGEFLLENIDITRIMQAKHIDAARVKNKFKTAILILTATYLETKNETGLKSAQDILAKYFKSDKSAQAYLKTKIGDY
jgi:hypothetical protein